MAKKKILFLTGFLPGGGAERVLIDILRHFDFTQYEVDLALFEKKGILLNDVPEEVNIIELWGKNSLNHFFAIKASLYLHNNISLARTMNGKKLRKDYDAEIAFLEGMPVKLLSMRKTKAPKFCWIHTDLSHFHATKSAFYNENEEKAAYSKMDTVICVSEFCKKGFTSCFPSIAGKTSLIYNPIDIDTIRKRSQLPSVNLKNSHNGINIITVSRLNREKNPLRLVETALLAKEESINLKFHLLGEGPLETSLKEEIKIKGLEEYFEFYGFQKNPYPLIAQSDIMVLPSDAEGFGLVLCEAMCLGIPVISTPTAGPTEILDNNNYGLLTDFTPKSILDAIKQLISDKDMKEKLIENGRRRVEDFSIDKMMNNFYSLLHP